MHHRSLLRSSLKHPLLKRQYSKWSKKRRPSPALLYPKPPQPIPLTREEVDLTLENQIRGRFRKETIATVEAIVQARSVIWGGKNGRKSPFLSAQGRPSTDPLSKTKVDKRQRNDMEQASKRQRIDKGEVELPIYATKFSDDVLASEERRPKKKVAVMIGYAGTGYRGMQL